METDDPLWRPLTGAAEKGRLKDVHERRPKLSTLNSTSSVKKWIPSIKSEIEYYLQQSQLSHYPERKIVEFQMCIEALEKEYKRFITKLRVLDPSCKDKPWTPRAYVKRRADIQDSPNTVMKLRCCGSPDRRGLLREGENALTRKATEGGETSADATRPHLSQSEGKCSTSVPASVGPKSSERTCLDQDQPLSFDRTRLAVAAAGLRDAVLQPGSSHTRSLARVLQSGLPNLCSSPLGQSLATQRTDAAGAEGKKMVMESVTGKTGAVERHKPSFEPKPEMAEVMPGKSHNTGTTRDKTRHVLGLDCYSSSDEGSDT
ncbi:uncharacterized protein si:dkey-86e18.1 isoform X2 [Lampris incognitus]|uniref:uncharacterized protein si:dkey-86e18.1 isoform X2 n=1 Tax=Lampris incognitus TaxID=2546036 RepID=UPI0024B51057|nr:uncharacterized protein si:dkey-86e18.1 isoform X2 [Lampris incognitus]